MDEVEAAVWFRYVSDLVRALSTTDNSQQYVWRRALIATEVLWSCYEDCALSDPPKWTIKQHTEGK